MSIDREFWLSTFTKSGNPPWQCPTCGKGLLEIKKETLHSFETASSIEAKDHDAWDPEWTRSRFTGVLICNYNRCKESVIVSGETHLVETYNYSDNSPFPEQDYFEVFEPQFFNPPLNIFPIPLNCPDGVTDEIVKSFCLFWVDPQSAGNRVRVAVEKLLDHQKISKFKTAKGKRQRLSLHQRIVSFSNRDKELSNYLLAIKWLGNAGSHSGDLTKGDMLDAYDILWHVIDELFVGKKKAITKLTKQIIQKKGPVKRKSR